MMNAPKSNKSILFNPIDSVRAAIGRVYRFETALLFGESSGTIFYPDAANLQAELEGKIGAAGDGEWRDIVGGRILDSGAVLWRITSRFLSRIPLVGLGRGVLRFNVGMRRLANGTELNWQSVLSSSMRHSSILGANILMIFGTLLCLGYVTEYRNTGHSSGSNVDNLYNITLIYLGLVTVKLVTVLYYRRRAALETEGLLTFLCTLNEGNAQRK